MTRVASGGVLIVLAVAVVWWAPSWLFFAVGELLLVLAFVEYARLAEACGLPIPRVAAGTATMLVSIGISSTVSLNDSVVGTAVLLDVMMMTSFVVLGSLTLVSSPAGPAGRIDREALGRAATAMFPMLYLGLPVGALVSLRAHHGREVLFLLMLAVMVSDTAQYYTGRAFGRRLLAPAISPKKTVEGAIGGFVFGGALVGIVGAWWLPNVPAALRVALGVTLVALGIAGDLFESMLKRSAGVKDSSALIPGHGGVLDRIDALLFAAPIYYIVLKYI
jgi:phosphatidate cytidylyltransferase